MRPIWTGSIAFGLINIPVKVYSGSEERALSFRMLDKHGHCPISYAKVCRITNKEVPYKDIVKGYEYQKGDYVILTDEDFEKVAPKKTKTIDIVQFTSENEVEARQIDKPYYLEPDAKSQKAYVLLREALKRSKKVGIARWVLRNKEHLAMIRSEGRALMLIGLRYADEVRSPDTLDLPKEKEAYTKQELDMALMLIKQLEEHFHAEEFKDTYTEDLKKIIDKKAKGKPIRVEGAGEPVPTDMRNLMATLKKSLEREKKRNKRIRRTRVTS
ncbi:TPA: Ku protein [Patescibacteria group bacterium]|nr:MAG: repair protein [Parcubacteria group bacterium GW2011_GWD2_42_14]HCC05282.1 Ku protein [Patescibacteria group bacterium]